MRAGLQARAESVRHRCRVFCVEPRARRQAGQARERADDVHERVDVDAVSEVQAFERAEARQLLVVKGRHRGVSERAKLAQRRQAHERVDAAARVDQVGRDQGPL